MHLDAETVETCLVEAVPYVNWFESDGGNVKITGFWDVTLCIQSIAMFRRDLQPPSSGMETSGGLL